MGCKFTMRESYIYRHLQICAKFLETYFNTGFIEVQRRSEVGWRQGQKTSLAPPCSNRRSFGSKYAVDESTCDIYIGTFRRPPAMIRCQGNFSTLPPRYASAEVSFSTLRDFKFNFRKSCTSGEFDI